MEDSALLAAIVIIVTIGLWITEAIPIFLTSIGLALSALALGLISWSKLISVVCDPVLQLLLGSLVIAKALTTSGLAERISTRILNSKIATKNPSILLLVLGLLASSLSLFISNTAVTAMLLPVGITLIEQLQIRQEKASIGVLLMLAWGSSVAVGSLIGSPPNLIAQSVLANNGLAQIGFLNWMAFAMPINVAMLVLVWFVLRCLYVERSLFQLKVYSNRELSRELGALSRSEKGAAAIFILIVLLWFLPEMFTSIGLGPYPMLAVLTPARVALLGALLLIFLPIRFTTFRTTIKLSEALLIDWRTIFLFGGGLLLGRLAFETGLATYIANYLFYLTGAKSQLAVTSLMLGLAIILSELTSNTASAALLLPLALAIAKEAGVNPIAPILGATIGSSFGFMMPISTPPNSIVYSSGLVPIREMLRAGFLIDLLGFFVTTAALWFVLPLLGWW